MRQGQLNIFDIIDDHLLGGARRHGLDISKRGSCQAVGRCIAQVLQNTVGRCVGKHSRGKIAKGLGSDPDQSEDYPR